MPGVFSPVFILTALVLMGVSVPLYLEKVKPNRLYGFRTPRTVHDERVWYPTNKVFARNMLLAAQFLLLAGVVAPFMGGGAATLLVLLGMLPVFLGVLHAFYWASDFVGRLDNPEHSGRLPTEDADYQRRGKQASEKEEA